MDFNTLVQKLNELADDHENVDLMESATKDQVKGKEKAKKSSKANPYSKHPFQGRLVGETEEVDEDLLSELTNEFIDFLELKNKEEDKEQIEEVPSEDVVEPHPDKNDNGLEGPYKFQSGAILYYDRKEGRYYDQETDMYVSDEDMMWHTGIKKHKVDQPADPGKEVINTGMNEEDPPDLSQGDYDPTVSELDLSQHESTYGAINALNFIKVYIDKVAEEAGGIEHVNLSPGDVENIYLRVGHALQLYRNEGQI